MSELYQPGDILIDGDGDEAIFISYEGLEECPTYRIKVRWTRVKNRTRHGHLLGEEKTYHNSRFFKLKNGFRNIISRVTYLEKLKETVKSQVEELEESTCLPDKEYLP